MPVSRITFHQPQDGQKNPSRVIVILVVAGAFPLIPEQALQANNAEGAFRQVGEDVWVGRGLRVIPDEHH